MKNFLANFLHKCTSSLPSSKGRFFFAGNFFLSKKNKRPIEDYEFDTFILSDIGCVRKRNEDSSTILYLRSQNDKAPGLLALVADGMGGHKAGNHASQLAVQIICDSISIVSKPSESNLEQAFLKANEVIFQEASENADFAGMGTTATALLIVEGSGWMAHVGDSRLYCLRNNQLKQLSQDHTLVANLVSNGFITKEQAKSHPDRNVLDRAMGTHKHLQIMHTPIDITRGNIFILCSDGLHDLVSDEEIQEKFINYSLQASCNQLIDLARSRGGFDNISIVSVRCEKSAPPPPIPSTRDAITISNV